MEYLTIPGSEQDVNECLELIANMAESPEKQMLTSAIKAHGGKYGEAIAACQRQAINEWTEQGYTTKAAIERASQKYPKIFKP